MDNGEDVPQDPLTGLFFLFKILKDWEMGSKNCVLFDDELVQSFLIELVN